jgi:hypothetical protein
MKSADAQPIVAIAVLTMIGGATAALLVVRTSSVDSRS